MDDLPDHYAALGIAPSADEEVIAAAYRALAKKFHPDSGTSRGTASAERFRAVQEAYEVLRDPGLRSRYDAAFNAQYGLPGAAATASLSGSGVRIGEATPSPLTPATYSQAPFTHGEPWSPLEDRQARTRLLPVAAAIIVLAAAAAALWFRAAEPPPAPPQVLPAKPAASAPAQPQVPPQPKTSAAPQPAAPLPREKPAQPAQQVQPAQPAAPPPPPPAPLFELVIHQQTGDAPATTAGASVMFSTRNKCQSFGEETAARLRAAASQQADTPPHIWFECREAQSQ